MIMRNEINTTNEYSNIEASSIYLNQLPAIKGSMGSIESFINRWHGYLNAIIVEGLITLGAAIGICLVAVLVRAGW